MSAETLVSGLAGLGLLALSGRLALAFLPAGQPGSQRLAQWPATWAASHLLGVIVLHALFVLASACDLRWSFCSLGLLLVLASLFLWTTGPGSMESRGTAPSSHTGPTAQLALLVVAVLTLLPILRAAPGLAHDGLTSLRAWSATATWQATPFRLLAPASRVALVVLLLRGLESAGLGPLPRRVALALGLLLPFAHSAAATWSDSLPAALLLGGGCAFAVAWLRRADPRAGVLAALAFAAAPAYERATWPLGLLGLVALVALTHRNARRTVWRASAAGLLLGAPTFATWIVDLDWVRS